jgi:hypothetical protein
MNHASTENKSELDNGRDTDRRPTAGAAPASPPLLRPPRALKPLKARRADECEQLEQLPNIGPSLAGDLRSIGITAPADLIASDAYTLYLALCARSGKRQDPCVLDTFIAACEFMRGAAPTPWWLYTARRKAQYGAL